MGSTKRDSQKQTRRRPAHVAWRLESSRPSARWDLFFSDVAQWMREVRDRLLGVKRDPEPRRQRAGKRAEAKAATRADIPVAARSRTTEAEAPKEPQLAAEAAKPEDQAPRERARPAGDAPPIEVERPATIAFEPPSGPGIYCRFFELTRAPFNITPDPRFYYKSEQHQEALANLVYGAQDRKGLIALTGEVGTGKTMLLECLKDYLAYHDIEFAFLSNSRITPADLFEMVAYELDLPCRSISKAGVMNALNKRLLERTDAGTTTVLIIDEAQNLEWGLLEEIRLLSNMESREQSLLQIVLAGQPEFEETIQETNLRQLRERITIHATLQPFTMYDTSHYIKNRLEKAGMAEQRVFPPAVVGEIHRRSRGIPRQINAICDRMMLAAFSRSVQITNLETLEEACEELRIPRAPDYRMRPASVPMRPYERLERRQSE